MATKKQATAPAAPAVLAENPEVALANREVAEILDRVARFGAFFKVALGLQRRATETLALAKRLEKPVDEASDTAVKDFVRLARTDLKEVGDHWEGICSLFFRFHRRLTAGRDKTTKPLDEAISIATKLHADYVWAEQQRVREEAERKRLQEEARAAEQRKREIEELEQIALAREAEATELSDRETSFCKLYVQNGGKAVEAASAVGYKDPFKQASRLLATQKIQSYIGALQEAEAVRQEADALKAAPLETREIEVVSNADTSGDRGTKSAVIVDEAALIAAVLEGKLGIPSDILTVKPAKLNEYARSLGPIINRWPGVRYQVKTTII
jgi:hypothetical protein